MAIGQITLIDLNDTRTGSLSLDSNHPRIQTYDPNSGKYNPDYEEQGNFIEITPQFILGNESISILNTQISYTINDKELGSEDLPEEKFYQKNAKLYIAQNLIVDYYHIEALVTGIMDGGVELPPFSASYDISKLSDGSSQSEIKFTGSNNNLVVKRVNGDYDPKSFTLKIDLSNYDFGDLETIYAYYYYIKDGDEINFKYNREEVYSVLTKQNPIGEYTFETKNYINTPNYAVTLFEDENNMEKIETVYLDVNLLQDGEGAYSLIIDDNKPVILSTIKDDGNYYATATDSSETTITLLNEDKTIVSINDININNSESIINRITFTPSILSDGKAKVVLSWNEGDLIEKTTATFTITFGQDNESELIVSITVLPLTGGKNGKDGKDSCLLILEPDPSDQFTPANNGKITITPYFYIGNNRIDNEKITFKWTIAGDTTGVAPVEKAIYEVSQSEVETQETYICEATYIEGEEEYKRVNRITIKNTLAPYYCEIKCLGGNTFKNGKAGNATLECTIYRTGEGIIVPPNVTYKWYMLEENSEINLGTYENNPKLTLSSDFYISNIKIIYCDVSF